MILIILIERLNFVLHLSLFSALAPSLSSALMSRPPGLVALRQSNTRIPP